MNPWILLGGALFNLFVIRIVEPDLKPIIRQTCGTTGMILMWLAIAILFKDR